MVMVWDSVCILVWFCGDLCSSFRFLVLFRYLMIVNDCVISILFILIVGIKFCGLCVKCVFDCCLLLIRLIGMLV